MYPSLGTLTQPFNPIQETGVVELVGKDEQVDQNDYGGSVAVALGPTGYNKPISGEILHVTVFSRETGSGSVQTPDGQLIILDADPATTAGDTAITAAERLTVIGAIPVETTDWISDANGASATIFTKPLAFHALHNLYFLWFHENATSFNDAAGDDEILEVNAWYRMDS
jgi:hypothetical protein